MIPTGATVSVISGMVGELNGNVRMSTTQGSTLIRMAMLARATVDGGIGRIKHAAVIGTHSVRKILTEQQQHVWTKRQRQSHLVLHSVGILSVLALVVVVVFQRRASLSLQQQDHR